MRKGYWLAFGVGLGVLTGLAVVALSYLCEQAFGLPFIPFVFFDWLTRALPGGIITLGIDSMVRIIVGLGLGPIDVVAKTMEQLLGIALWLVASAATGVALAAWLRRPAAARPGTGWKAGACAGLGLALLVVIAMFSLHQFAAGQSWSLLWPIIVLPGWGAVLGTLLERLGRPAAPSPAVPGTPGMRPRMSRREFLLLAGGGSVLIALVAGELGSLLAKNKAHTGAGQPLGKLSAAAAAPVTPVRPSASPVAAATGAAATATTPQPAAPEGPGVPAPGTRPEVTSNADFYRIDIDLAPPELAESSWQVRVSGLFDRPRDLTLGDLLAMPAVTQPITQSCISNPIGGDLISSAYYTGVRLRDVLEALGVQPAATQLALHTADDFYESVALQDMQDPRVLLVYGMNGTTLPVSHGYPLRIYIPNRYGMKQPKWITSMEAIDHNGSGYWVDRGWSVEARPQVISIIDTVAKDSIAGGRVPVGGIAWAGDRGIKSVEVQVDGGAWDPATLITPPLGPLTWVRWRYDWPVTPGRHTFRVRATDGKGALQSGQDRDTYPDGATGYHTATVAF
jgi:DMSO/TMAO reductase YedYZ molybdopterin-dependent catalytic subunit